MKTPDRISVAQVAVNQGDDGRAAARVAMIAIGLLFALIFVLQTMSP